MSQSKLPVIIAGAGPVGMVAAADLVRQGIAVLVLEKGAALASESRASSMSRGGTIPAPGRRGTPAFVRR